MADLEANSMLTVIKLSGRCLVKLSTNKSKYSNRFNQQQIIYYCIFLWHFVCAILYVLSDLPHFLVAICIFDLKFCKNL